MQVGPNNRDSLITQESYWPNRRPTRFSDSL